MVKTVSTMLPLGTAAPDFSLPDVVTGQLVALKTLTPAKGLLVFFISRHCPYVVHVQNELVKIGNETRSRGVAVVAICANDETTHPADRPEALAEMARDLKAQFPFCHDATQAVAKAYTAACTPDIFLFDGALRLVYRGQLDDSRPRNAVPVSGQDLRAAVEALLNGTPQARAQKPSMGCNIKWRAGNEPDYFGAASV